MNKNRILNILSLIILIVGTMDISIPEYEQTYLLNAGVNGKQIQQGIKIVKGWLRSCAQKRPKSIKPNDGEYRLFNRRLIKNIISTTEMLSKDFEEINVQEELLPKIGNYLSQTEPNKNGNKIIKCIRTESNKVRMALYEQESTIPKKEKIIKVGSDIIDLTEYDIQHMQENYYKGSDGMEYVAFIIPRRPQYILNGLYKGRINESMEFHIPKDINGNWKKFKEYLKEFLKYIMSKSEQVWDEYQFRRGLIELNINIRDVQEIEQYMFAQMKSINGENEAIQSIHTHRQVV